MRRNIKLGTVAAAVILVAIIESQAQTPLPHSFGSITALSDQTISLTLTGRVASALRPYFDIYPIEVSSDLVTWIPLATLVRTNASTNALIHIDSEAVAFSARFYRTFANQLVTPLAKPSGPYAVGRVSRLMTDPSRTNRYNIKTNSSFMLTIWYPAQDPAGVLPDRYLEPQMLNYISEPENAAQMFAFSISNAAMRTNEAAYPVAVYSHGWGSFRRRNTEMAQELASHGYIVAAMDHIDSFLSVFPDGRLVEGIDSSLPYTEEVATRTLPDRVTDIIVVLDELTRLNQDGSMFAGRMDLARVGGFAHSAGVATIAEAARVDERIKALVLYEGYLQGAVDTIHPTFVDLRPLALANATSRRAAEAIRACSLSFFNKYLKGEDDHLLDNPTNRFPVIFNYLKK